MQVPISLTLGNCICLCGLQQASDCPHLTPPNSEVHRDHFYHTENCVNRNSSTVSTKGKTTVCTLQFDQQEKSFLFLLSFTGRKTEFMNIQVILIQGLTPGREVAAYAGNS